MANEDIAFNLDVNTTGGAKSLADLKKEFKELQSELSKTKVGSEEYYNILKKLGAVKDDIGDLRDTISALNPEGKVAAFAKLGSTIASGFAAAQGAAALFGAESEELQKTMLKVQAAMALAEGIKGITAAGDAFRVLNTVMKANPILAIVAGFTALTTAAVAVYKHFQDVNSVSSQMAREHEKLKESTASLTKSIDIQITALKGLKANDEAILGLTEKKLKANIELAKSSLQVALAKEAEAKSEFDYMEQSLRLSGNIEEADKIRLIRTKEQRDATKAAIESLKESIAGLAQFHNEAEQKKVDATTEANKKQLEDYKKYLKDREDALYQAHLNEVARFEQARKDAAEKEKQQKIEEQDALNQSVLDAEAEYQNDSFIQEQKANSDKEFAEEMSRKRRIDGYKEMQGQQLALTKQTLQSAQALTDLYFQHQFRMAKGNADRERELKKKQFNVNKAFGVANSIIDGVGAIQKALNNPYPLNIILAVLTGILATANTVKIATAKFDDGGASAGGGDVGGSLSTGAAPAVPQPNNTVTKIDDSGKIEDSKPKDQRVFVVETDITDKNKRVANIEETAKIK